MMEENNFLGISFPLVKSTTETFVARDTKS